MKSVVVERSPGGIRAARRALAGILMMSALTGCDSGPGSKGYVEPPLLSIAIDGPELVAAREPVFYTITVRNNGGQAYDMKVAAQLPEDMVDVVLTGDGVLTGRQASWPVLDELQTGYSTFFSVQARASKLGRMVTRVTITYRDAADNPQERVAVTGTDVDFTTLYTLSGTGNPSTAALGEFLVPLDDIDMDGVGDLAVSEWAGAEPWRIHIFSGADGHLIRSIFSTGGAMFGMGNAGDVDGDGFDDLIVGTSNAADPRQGAVLVYSASLGSILLTVYGDGDFNRFGGSVASAGDVNGDGRPDLLIGDSGYHAPGSTAGRVYVYSGMDGSRLLTANGPAGGDAVGLAVASVGDLNGDLVPDIVTSNGPSLLVFSGMDGSTVLQPLEIADADELVWGLSSPGDMNGDGIPDILVGDTNHDGRGSAWVFSGSDGTIVYAFTGEQPDDGYGDAHAAGDVDGDGVPDLLICAWRNDDGATDGGKVYLISGRDGSTIRTFVGRVDHGLLGLEAIAMDDVDGDGSIDYLISSQTRQIAAVKGVSD